MLVRLNIVRFTVFALYLAALPRCPGTPSFDSTVGFGVLGYPNPKPPRFSLASYKDRGLVLPRPSNSSKIGFRLNIQAKKSTRKRDSGMLRTRPRETHIRHILLQPKRPTLSPQQPSLLLLLLLPTCSFEKNKYITSLVE